MADDAGRPARRSEVLFGLIGSLMLLICLWLRAHRAPIDLCLGGSALLGCYTLMVLRLWRSPGLSKHFVLVALALGLAMRLAFLTDQAPLVDDDIWRYRWDGRVITAGINPYRHAPIDDALDHLDDGSRLNIGFPWVKTIYPPVAEGLFALTARLHPSGIWPFKVLAVAGDLLTILPLVVLLQREHRAYGWLLLYVWHPTVLKECADSGHIDAWVALPLLLGLLVRSKAAQGLWLALATGIKLVPVVLVPWWLTSGRSRSAFLVAGVTMALWAFTWPDGLRWESGGWGAFSGQWEFNSGLFAVTQGLTSLAGLPGWLPRWVMAGLFGAFGMICFRRFRDPIVAAQVIYLSLFAVSPVVNPWYFVPVIALTVLRPHPVVLAGSILVNLSYAHYLNVGDGWYRLIEYGGMGLALWHWHRHRRAATRPQPIGAQTDLTSV